MSQLLLIKWEEKLRLNGCQIQPKNLQVKSKRKPKLPRNVKFTKEWHQSHQLLLSQLKATNLSISQATLTPPLQQRKSLPQSSPKEIWPQLNK
jgi:hypothetical protein